MHEDCIKTVAAILWAVGGKVVIKPDVLRTMKYTDYVEKWEDPMTGFIHYTVKANDNAGD